MRRHRDRLLDIFDRGSFDEDFAYARRGSTDGVAVVMLDIDHFKRVNDAYGHQVGDAVLQAVARVLAIGCLCDSEPYRYGGEEFAVILTQTTKAEAMDFAESIRAEVEIIPFEHQPELRVTVSVGVAATPGDGSDAVKLLQNADFALYRAKREGRNRVR